MLAKRKNGENNVSSYFPPGCNGLGEAGAKVGKHVQFERLTL